MNNEKLDFIDIDPFEGSEKDLFESFLYFVYKKDKNKVHAYEFIINAPNVKKATSIIIYQLTKREDFSSNLNDYSFFNIDTIDENLKEHNLTILNSSKEMVWNSSQLIDEDIFPIYSFKVHRKVSIWVIDKYTIDGKTFGEAKAKIIKDIVLEDGEWGNNMLESRAMFETEEFLPPSHSFATKEIRDEYGNVIWDNKL